MMKQDNKNKELRENQKYVSPSVKVIEVTAQRVLCGSTNTGGSTEQYGSESTNPWA